MPNEVLTPSTLAFARVFVQVVDRLYLAVSLRPGSFAVHLPMIPKLIGIIMEYINLVHFCHSTRYLLEQSDRF